MNPTNHQQITQKASQALRRAIICSGCRRVFGFTDDLFQTKQLGDGVEKIGFECPHCRRWHHSFYLNSELKLLRDKITDRNSRRHFQREFTKFQGKMAKKVRADAVIK
jgi:hypothetical protein